MFLIPGQIISLITFPGIIIHEWAHKFFCERFGVKVLEVKYFQFKGKVAGYVLHENPKTYKQTFWISVGPLIVNSLFAIIISFIATQVVAESFFWYLLFWIAISSGMHSFPSDQDMSHVLVGSKEALKSGGSMFHYFSFSFVWIIFIANKLRFFWFDLIWAFLLVGIGGGFVSITDQIYTDNNYGARSELHTQIENCKNETKYLENQINQDESLLKNLESRMNSYENYGDTLSYNNLVSPYNSLLAKIKNEYPNYEAKLNSCNKLVDVYNNK